MGLHGGSEWANSADQGTSMYTTICWIRLCSNHFKSWQLEQCRNNLGLLIKQSNRSVWPQFNYTQHNCVIIWWREHGVLWTSTGP